MPSGHTQFGRLADTLRTSLCLYQLPCEHTDGYSRPEVEFRDSEHLILPPQHLLGSKQDEILIETAINSVRISLKVRISMKAVLSVWHWLGCSHTSKKIQSAHFASRLFVAQMRPTSLLDDWLRNKHIQLIQRHADEFRIVRRLPVPGYCLSFLVTVEHLQLFDKALLIGCICECITQLSSAHDLKRLAVLRGRAAGSALWRCLPD